MARPRETVLEYRGSARLVGLSLACVLAWTLGRQVVASEGPIGLAAGQIALDRLGPDAPSGTTVFQVDEASLLRVEITSNLPDLATSVEGPGGQILNDTTVTSFGGRYVQLSGGPLESPLILPGLRPGYHLIYAFPSLGPGAYTVHFASPSVPTEDAAVITELFSDSPVVAGLFATEPVIPTGSLAVLSAAVFEGGSPIVGASVSVSIKPPVGEEFVLVLRDDGIGADHAAGDGLYSGLFPVTEVGDHEVVAQISGTNSHGTAFTRTAAAPITAVPGGARLTGTLSDQGVDDNSNGLFDRVIVSAGVEVTIPGTYHLRVILEIAGGKTLLGHGQSTLPAGPGNLTAEFDAADFLEAGEDGPYTITDVELSLLGDSGLQPSDWITDGTQATLPYLLSQFERPAIELTGMNSDLAVDADADGDFDRLEARIGNRIRVPGTYEYLARLDDPCGQEIQSISGQQAFPSGATPEALVLEFDGRLVGVRA